MKPGGNWDRATRFVAAWGNQPGKREALQREFEAERRAAIEECARLVEKDTLLRGAEAAYQIRCLLAAPKAPPTEMPTLVNTGARFPLSAFDSEFNPQPQAEPHGSPQCDQGCELGCRYKPQAEPRCRVCGESWPPQVGCKRGQPRHDFESESAPQTREPGQ